MGAWTLLAPCLGVYSDWQRCSHKELAALRLAGDAHGAGANSEPSAVVLVKGLHGI